MKIFNKENEQRIEIQILLSKKINHSSTLEKKEKLKKITEQTMIMIF